MLQKLVIKNIALIDYAEINFTKGLNVLSGETGAGKSVIIESLNFVLGAKADKTLIRTGADECFVKAEFDVSDNDAIFNLYKEFDLECENELIVTRKFNVDGKSSVKINGNTITLGMLKRFTSVLVDVHGQSEHFHLLKTANQLDLIDRFGGEKISKVKEQLKELFSIYKDLVNRFNELGGNESERLVRLDILNYQIGEIEKVNLRENEEEELLILREKIKHQEKIVNTLNAVKSAIKDEGGVCDVLSNVARLTSGVVEFGKEYSDLHERLNGVFSEIDDIADSANSILDDTELYKCNPDEIEERLSAIKNLKKKYGNGYAEIVSFLEKAKEEKNRLENFNDTAVKLENEIEKIKKKIYIDYCELHDLRRDFSDSFSGNVIRELVGLGMPKAKFSVNISDKPIYSDCQFESSNGFDVLEFMFSANVGEPLKPLSSVISGGEMSRFMLAIKAQTAKYNDISTFIFDEIDTGISGNVAKVVAEKFAVIAKNVQIIAITHLPQISAMADNNLLIVKTDDGVSAHTKVLELTKDDKVCEIMRLIGGSAESATAKNHAKELIEIAEKFKNDI